MCAVTGADCLAGTRAEEPTPRPVTALRHCFSRRDEPQGHHALSRAGALHGAQLCGFRRPRITAGLSTPSTLFRKLKRLVVVSEMTRLKFWSWHRLVPLLNRVGKGASTGAGGPKPEAVVVATDSRSAASSQLLLSPFMWAQKELIRQRVSILLKHWGERGGSWAANRGRIYNSENHVSVEFSLFHGRPRAAVDAAQVCVLAMLRLHREPAEGRPSPPRQARGLSPRLCASRQGQASSGEGLALKWTLKAS